jgi:hypothetical protein
LSLPALIANLAISCSWFSNKEFVTGAVFVDALIVAAAASTFVVCPAIFFVKVIVLFHSVVLAPFKANVNLYVFGVALFSVKFATALIFTVLLGLTVKLSFFPHVNVLLFIS